MSIPMWVLWLILLIIFAIIEAMTLGLTTVWFAIGSGVAMIMDFCGAPVVAQIITMIIVSIISFIVCFIWIRPAIDRKGRGTEPTNADRTIGQEGIVIKAIDPIEGKGQVKVIGQVWSAKADSNINEGARIMVLGLEGVKLVVEEIKE
ncbi:Membrane protein implicated in regulation of membrane protease activity [Ruminococcaceae bacterium YRB3002]|nr:Membrane protein implicated in regulation of membrane protease activity [Ruminococcaceae bacterium YRB3002]